MPGGVSNNYIVRVLGENGWAWLSRCKPPPPPPPLPPPPSLQSLLDTHKVLSSASSPFPKHHPHQAHCAASCWTTGHWGLVGVAVTL